MTLDEQLERHKKLADREIEKNMPYFYGFLYTAERTRSAQSLHDLKVLVDHLGDMNYLHAHRYYGLVYAQLYQNTTFKKS